ncbi:MAG: dTDP-4-dehydrorhamnose 3,5-epimerase family protein [Acidobacteria bacterium]|nr:dTDP-4-dehydrorhamnose 3,5-epimerase family protein [Acidobacteriota bacterium]MCA1640403.1 dTDP-4-dehydrorhamnose 3,5-epimerase family protein [Acidobacteriota bacterium]
MIFIETSLKGAFIIEPERFADERGFFAQSFSRGEFERHGLSPRLEECNISFNLSRGTLRGMHFQSSPRAQAKLVRCTAGAIYDVAIDLRRDSPTFKRWVGVELTAESRRMFFVPEGFAHGYLTLEKNTETFYQVSEAYIAVEVVNERDNSYADFASR